MYKLYDALATLVVLFILASQKLSFAHFHMVLDAYYEDNARHCGWNAMPDIGTKIDWTIINNMI